TNTETLLNRLLESFEYLLVDDIVSEIVVDETLWKPLVGGNLADAIIKEPKNSHWRRGDNLTPICTLDYIAAGRPPTIMLKSRKGVILSWPINE
ncbi:unnamed protein product, partial [marine sediment metagenome]